jgi:tight adherence protein B
MLTAALAALLVAMLSVAMAAVSTPPARTVAAGPRRARVRPDDFAGFLDAVARQVRTGSSLGQAINAEAAAAPAFAAAARALSDGAPVALALGEIRPSCPDMALTVQALAAVAQFGGPIAPTLDSAAQVLRERAAARAERRAHSAQARLSARVLTVVPVAFAVWNMATSEPSRAIYRSGPGVACAALGGLLNVAGWRWMNRAITRS